MYERHWDPNEYDHEDDIEREEAPTPGKRTRTEQVVRSAGAWFGRATSGSWGEVPYRGEMERAFGQDFGDVRAHVGGESVARGLRALGAGAATRESTIAFASDRPSREIVAHELAHVTQNRAARAPRGGMGGFGRGAEADADAAAATVLAGGRPQVSASPGASIQRTPETDAAAARVLVLLSSAAGARDAARVQEIVQALQTASAGGSSRDADLSASSSEEVTLHIGDEALTVARSDLRDLISEAESAARRLPRPPDAERTFPFAPYRDDVDRVAAVGRATSSRPPVTHTASGDTAADAASIGELITIAAASRDAAALERILQALEHAHDGAARSDAASGASGASGEGPVTVSIGGEDYSIARADLARLIQDGETAAAQVMGPVDLATPPPSADTIADGVPMAGAVLGMSVGASATMPVGTEFFGFLATPRARDVENFGDTTIGVEITPAHVRISFLPSLDLDILGPFDATLGTITYDFADRSVTTDAAPTLGAAPIGTINSMIQDYVRQALSGTRANERGYNPARDADVMETALAIQSNIMRIMHPDGAATEEDPEHRSLEIFHNPTLTAEIASRDTFDAPAGPGALAHVVGGSPIRVRIEGAGTGAGLATAAESGLGAAATAFDLQVIRISTEALSITDEEHQLLVTIREIEIRRGGTVRVTQLDGHGVVALAEVSEAVVRAFAGVAAAADGRDPSSPSEGIIPRELSVDCFTRQTLEDGLLASLRRTLADYPTVGGVDVREFLGMGPASGDPPMPGEPSLFGCPEREPSPTSP